MGVEKEKKRILKIKQHAILVWNIFRDVTTDTTNKDPRPEDPCRGTGNEVDYRIFWRCVNSATPLTKVLAPVDDDAVQLGSSKDRTY